jgi:methionine synthase II (cobalamin-independent)
MFGTLLGALPRPPDAEDPLATVLRAQEEAGLEPLTDGRPAAAPGDTGEGPVERWRRAQGLTQRAVKAALVGPYTLSWGESRSRGSGTSRARRAMSAAAWLHDQVLALAEAGCPLVEVQETEAQRIGADAMERRLFTDAHQRLADDVAGIHLSLSIVGSSADAAGVETILAAPYASLAVDLIAGPDNWRLVARTPGDRGIVAGVIEARQGSDDRPELPVWAAHYAASTGGRGLARVGLGTAGGLAHLPWPVAVAKLRRLGDAARIAGLARGEQADALDPRAVDIRTAALGRHAPPPPRRPRRRP